MTTVINLFGGPGIGKSTIASGLLYNLKLWGKSVELVTEYAKDVTYEGSHVLLENQLHIFAEQCRRQHRLLGQVDYIITDSPLMLSTVYVDWHQSRPGVKIKHNTDYLEKMKDFFFATWCQFENLSYLLTRNVQYDKLGRNESEGEAKEIDNKIRDMLNQHYIHYNEIGPFTGLTTILDHLKNREFWNSKDELE